MTALDLADLKKVAQGEDVSAREATRDHVFLSGQVVGPASTAVQ